MPSQASRASPGSAAVTRVLSAPGFRSGSWSNTDDWEQATRICYGRIQRCALQIWRTPGPMCVRIGRRSSSRYAPMKQPRNMARLYADENFPQPAVERLRELGHDVQTVQEAGKAQQKRD